jgi:SAM-dependent methyltransferase
MMLSQKVRCLMCGFVQKGEIYDCCPKCKASSIHYERYGLDKLKRWITFDVDSLFVSMKNTLYSNLFDWYYSVDTKEMVTKKELNVNNSSRFDMFAVYYAAAHFTTIHKALSLLPLDKTVSTLLDLGSGKGRVLMYALLYGYQNVIGVEYSKKLTAITNKNLLLFDKDRKYNYEVINKDASEYMIDPNVDAVFMFNPFLGLILDLVVKNIIQASKNKDIYVIFVNQKESLPHQFTPYYVVNDKTIIYKITSGSSLVEGVDEIYK